MSHHVSVTAPSTASFFPTPAEITGGLRWIKKNPGMAVATCAAAMVVAMAACFAMQSPEDPPEKPRRLDMQIDSTSACVEKNNSIVSPSGTERDSSSCSLSSFSNGATSDERVSSNGRLRSLSDDDNNPDNLTPVPSRASLERLLSTPENDDIEIDNEDCERGDSPDWGWYV
jgi:hypothetical protein